MRGATASLTVATHVDTFTVRLPFAELADVRAGADQEASTVVIVDRRGPRPVTRRWKVRGVENRAGGTAVDSVRLELDAEGAA